MQYIISFLEGIITFISPCLLPMLPIYISYFAGGGQRTQKRTLICALGFVLGFTAVFTAMGALAGTLGGLLLQYNTIVNIVSGAIIILFGLNYLEIIRLNLFTVRRKDIDKSNMTFLSSLLFGVIFSIGWTPCVGAFLGSALIMASQQGKMLTGIMMLLSYSLGLGIPFLLSAILIDQLKSTFNWIKQHYNVINKISGSLLIILGAAMATGLLGKLLNLLG